jgi:hypothetical protein
MLKLIKLQTKELNLIKHQNKSLLHGSSQINTRSTIVGLNPLEVLHVKLGHVGEDTIKWAVRNNSMIGLGYTFDQIKNLNLKQCPACMEGKMEAFPVPPSITTREYGIFEYLSVDILAWTYTSVRGYLYTALYVDKCTKHLFHYHMKSKSELLDTFKSLIHDYGNGKNPASLHVRYLQGDSGSEMLSSEFTQYTNDNFIILLVGAPYKHQQVLVEPYVKQVKNGLRTVLAYNNTPLFYYCYAFDYFIYTYNKIPRIGVPKTRHELFFGEKPDVSNFVPFYADGFYHVSPDERKALQVSKPFQARGRRCRMLGYPSSPHMQSKNSYLCLQHGTSNNIATRHDCYFKHFTDNEPCLLSAEVEKRSPDTFIREQLVDYSILTQANQSEVEEQLAPEVLTEQLVPEVLPAAENKNDDKNNASNNSCLPENEDELFNAAFNNNYTSNYDDSKDDPNDEIIFDTGNIDELTRSHLQLPTPRRTGRNRKIVKRFAFAASLDSSEQIESEVINDRFLDLNDIPKSMTQARTRIDRSKWELAMETEMTRINERLTYDICSEEDQDNPSLKAIKSKFAFRLTRKPDGSLKYKVRLVACGYSQVFGRDYESTYAPTASYQSFCIIMQLAAVHDWYIKGIDVENAYLEAKIDKDIYMYLPPEQFSRPNGKHVKVKLNQSLYGLKQAGELWFQLLRSKLLDLGYTSCIYDRCVYVKIDPESGTRCYVVVYVDDIIFTGNNEPELEKAIQEIGSQFKKISDLGEITRYIGVDIERDYEKHTISLSQVPYVETYLRDKDTQSSLNSKPMPLNPLLDYDSKGDGSIEPIREEVGRLRYLADRTRPEMLYHIGKLARAGDKPSENHISGLKHINRYLKGSVNKKLTLGGDDKEINLFGLSDASYVTRHDSLSQLAYCFFLNKTSGTICARSKKDTTVSHSSAEAEIKAIDLAVLKALCLRGLLAELGYPQLEPTIIYTDSISAKTLAETLHTSNNSAHLIVRINFIHQEIAAGTIVLKYINTDNMVADVLTKALSANPFNIHAEKLLTGFGNVLPDTSRRTKPSKRLGKKLK